MLFSELIASEDYKPRPNARSGDKNKVIQRLTLNAHRAFEDAVAEGKVDVLNERHYVMASELVDAAGGTFNGRDRRLEDFNLDMDSDRTKSFLEEYFRGSRSYGPRKSKAAEAKDRPPEYKELQKAIEILWTANSGETKDNLLRRISDFKTSFKKYAEIFRPISGLVPEE